MEESERTGGRKVMSFLEDQAFPGCGVCQATLQAIEGEYQTWPGVALPRPELRSPEHQDGASDHRPPGRRGRDPGGFAPAEALQEKGNAPYPQAQPCCECAHGRRSGAHDSEAGWGTRDYPRRRFTSPRRRRWLRRRMICMDSGR